MKNEYYIKAQDLAEVQSKAPALVNYDGSRDWSEESEIEVTFTETLPDDTEQQATKTELQSVSVFNVSGLIRSVDSEGNYIPTEYDQYGNPIAYQMESGYLVNVISLYPIEVDPSILIEPTKPQFKG